MSSFDAATDLTEAKLRENFAHWISLWDPCIHPAEDDCLGLKIPTTHTFAAEAWLLPAGPHIYPYRQILFEDEALLSNDTRNRLGKVRDGERQREMPEARAVKLDRFVFAYLGVHDPYYATGSSATFAYKAFGAFFRIDLDVFPLCNATRRDLHVEKCKEYHREFLLPRDARIYSQYLTLNETGHGDDFWHYWGAYRYWLDSTYRAKHWKSVVEFHYRDFVPVGKLDAILWPMEFVATHLPHVGHVKDDIESRSEIELFRQRHPEVQIIPYQWSSVSHAFVRASHATVLYLLKNKRYPLDAEDAQAALDQ